MPTRNLTITPFVLPGGSVADVRVTIALVDSDRARIQGISVPDGDAIIDSVTVDVLADPVIVTLWPQLEIEPVLNDGSCAEPGVSLYLVTLEHKPTRYTHRFATQVESGSAELSWPEFVAGAVDELPSAWFAHITDAAVHVPPGGNAGEVLSKGSDADGETVWIAAGGGGHVIYADGVEMPQQPGLDFIGASGTDTPGVTTIEGLQGEPGTGIVFRGSDTWSNIQAIVDPVQNDAWALTEATGAPARPDATVAQVGDWVVWDGSAWTNVGSHQGEQGDQGEPGAPGADGSGIQFMGQDTWANISAIPDAAQGDAWVLTDAAGAPPRADDSAADVGDWVVWDGSGWANTGPRDGADGKSAYEVAVEEGFTGTEQEWLDSLQGDAGADGPPGPTAVSADADNQAVISANDSLIYVPLSTPDIPDDGNMYIGQDGDWTLLNWTPYAQSMGFFALAAPGKSFVPGDIVTLIELTDPQPEPPEFATWDRGVVDEVQPSAAYALPDNINALPLTDGPGLRGAYVVNAFGEALAQKYVVKDNSADVIGPINWKLTGLQFSGSIGNADQIAVRWSICADDGAGNPDLSNELFPATGFDWSTLTASGEYNQEVYVSGTEADFAFNNGDTIWLVLYYESNPDVSMRCLEYQSSDEDQYCYFEEDYCISPPEDGSYVYTTNNGGSWLTQGDKRYARVGILLERTTKNNPPSAIFGVCLEPITDSQQGAVTTLGTYIGNTTGAPVGETWELNDQIYINVDNASQHFGKATRVPPTDPLDIIPIGQVLDVDATNGHVIITCAVTALRGFYMTPGIYDPRSRYRDIFNLDNIDLGTLSSGRINWDTDILLTNQKISWFDGDDDTHDVTLPDDLFTIYGNISDNAAQIAQNALDIQTLQSTTQWVRTSANLETIVGDLGSASNYNAAPLNIDSALVDTESAVDIVANTVTVTADMILEGVLRWIVVFTPDSYSSHSGAFCIFVDGLIASGQEFAWNAEDVGGGVVHVPPGTTGTTGIQEFNIAALSDGAVVEVRPMVVGNSKTVVVDSYIFDISKSGVVSGKRPAITVTADRAITVNDDMHELVCNSASPIALTMDAGLPIDFEVLVTRLGAGSVTVYPDASDSLNGAASPLQIDNQYQDVRIRRYI